MLQKQAEKNYLCSLTDKRKTMKHTNPQVEQMTSFIVMDVLERANELQKQGWTLSTWKSVSRTLRSGLCGGSC